MPMCSGGGRDGAWWWCCCCREEEGATSTGRGAGESSMRCAGLNLRCPPGVARRVEEGGVCGCGHGGCVVGIVLPLLQPVATAAAATAATGGSSTTSKPSSSLPRLLVDGGAVCGGGLWVLAAWFRFV